MTSLGKHWQVFEHQVKDALEALGYVVIRDKLIAGTQVDLYAELERELFVHRLVVECKETGDPTGVEAARQLYALTTSISTNRVPIFGLLVSASGFTRTALQFAESAGLSLKTLYELAALSFDPLPVISHIIRWFENDELGQSYVDLSCQVNESGQGTIYKPVEAFLDKFFATTKRPGIAVLGNFGTGKTSLCKHYAYLLAQRWNSDLQNSPLPIYVNLRDLHSLLNLEDDLLGMLNESYHATVTRKGVILWLQHRNTLLLLDGFDEMASRLDRASIGNNLSGLSRFIERYNAKVILTCRTHFFKTQVDEDTLKGMMRLYMRDWGSDELREYVQKSVPKRTDDALAIIRSVYNLEELAKTPLFLNMITSTIGEVITSTIGEVGGAINQSKLYQLYTDRWIESQDYRSRLTAQQKRQFMEELAFEMFYSRQPRIQHGVLSARVASLFKLRDYESIVAFDEDIRTCTFLVRDPDGQYYFVHRSYMEFFVAFRLATQVKENNLEDFSRCEMSKEIAGFFSNYFDSDWSMLMRLMMGSSSDLCRANCAMALGLLRYHPQIHDSLVLALGTETSLKARMRIVDALVSLGRPEGINEIVKYIGAPGEFGTFCLKAMASHITDKEVVDRFQVVLEHDTDPQRISIVLNGVTASKSTEFRGSVLHLLRERWWYKSEVVVDALLGVIPTIADRELALATEVFQVPHLFSEQQQARIAIMMNELRTAIRPTIEDEARMNWRGRMAYRNNEGSIRGRYGFLVDDDFLKALLTTLYAKPERTRSRNLQDPKERRRK